MIAPSSAPTMSWAPASMGYLNICLHGWITQMHFAMTSYTSFSQSGDCSVSPTLLVGREVTKWWYTVHAGLGTAWNRTVLAFSLRNDTRIHKNMGTVWVHGKEPVLWAEGFALIAPVACTRGRTQGAPKDRGECRWNPHLGGGDPTVHVHGGCLLWLHSPPHKHCAPSKCSRKHIFSAYLEKSLLFTDKWVICLVLAKPQIHSHVDRETSQKNQTKMIDLSEWPPHFSGMLLWVPLLPTWPPASLESSPFSRVLNRAASPACLLFIFLEKLFI